MSGRRVPLGELVTFVGGGTPARGVPQYWGAGYPWATVKDLTDMQLSQTQESITREGLKNSSSTLVPVGSIVIATRMALGKAAINTNVVAINQDLKALMCGPDVDPRYLLHFLISQALRIQAMGKGATVKGVTLDRLSELTVPVPPLTEQRRIASILDQGDAIRLKRRESLRLLDEFLRSAFLEMFGDPVRNEKGWEVVRLGEIEDFLGGGTPSRANPDYYKGTICWATSKDFLSEEMLDTQEHLTPQAIENSTTCVVPPGTILVVVKSKILMHRLPVAITRVPMCFSQDVKAITARDSGIPAVYLARHLRVGQQALLHKARGANTEGLTLDHLRDYRVMVPPRPKLQLWEAIESKYRSMQLTAVAQLTHSGALCDSLAQRAFGEPR